MFRVFPGASVGESLILGSTHRRSDTPGVSDDDLRRMHAIVLDIVRNEDYRVAREAFRSAQAAPPGFAFVFGRNEALLQRYHRDLAAAVDMRVP
jgi:hypothetical protein